MSERRTYCGEMEHALNQACNANHDRNPNRYAQVNGWLNYGIAVAIARRSKEPLPDRPQNEELI
jgi:hypothetical protein